MALELLSYGNGLHFLLKMSVKEWKVDSNRVPSVLGTSALPLGWPSLATFASILWCLIVIAAVLATNLNIEFFVQWYLYISCLHVDTMEIDFQLSILGIDNILH